ncbi:acyltransferase family protein [Massilia sp. TS11]|uniref:acyltransferase family protein n=1 Tax=Massilia sp. TS11 TaxID=2908003 RepID=UPI001ED9F9F3|nr:acyltransferase family protein [Massilia sp. TS11]MCG2584941.1 acyltransferase [Massilia sp. TS11]
MTTTPPRPAARLTELDWLRIIAFGLLILYHVGMYYVTWGWHVKSPQLLPELETWMLWLNPWRLPLLFLISGATLGIVLERAKPGQTLLERSSRLLLPLIFGMAVIVPPQAYYQAIEKYAYAGSFADFLGLYYRGYSGFCQDGKCMGLPTWNHLWFVLYLWAYSALLIILSLLPKWNAPAVWRQLVGGTRLLWVPWLLLAIFRQHLWKAYPSTHDFWGDWYNHALYGYMFLMGAVLFGSRTDRTGAWDAAVRLRWWALGIAVVAQLIMILIDYTPPEWALMIVRPISALRQWLPIVAIFGFARLHLAGVDNRLREFLSRGVFCFYILHQTLIVVLAVNLSRLHLPQPLEGALLVLLTALGCLGGYALLRHVPGLAYVLGIFHGPAKRRAATTSPT